MPLNEVNVLNGPILLVGMIVVEVKDIDTIHFPRKDRCMIYLKNGDEIFLEGRQALDFSARYWARVYFNGEMN